MYKYLKSLFFLLLVLTISSCVKDDFDEPPSADEIDISSEDVVSIASVLDMLDIGTPKAIGLDKYIYATVIGDDESGNIYKTLILKDDSNRGIAILIDDTDLFNQFPVGRNIYVHLKDLFISDYNNLPQLAYVNGDRIPAGIYKDIVFGDSYNNPVEPVSKNIGDLTFTDVNTLIRLDEVEFLRSEVGSPFSDPDFSTNRMIVDCNDEEIIIRTSSFSSFASNAIPGGNGHIVALLGVFGNDFQLTLRSLEDLEMNNPACDSNTTGNEVKMNISEVRDLYANGTTTAPEVYIEGVVISDFSTESVHPLNMVVQDGNSGIVLRFTGDHNITKNTSVRVVLTGASLSEFNGLLQVSGLGTTEITNLGSGSVEPTQITIENLLNNFESYESTLIKIVDAEINGGGSFSGGKDVTDGTGTVEMYTRSASSFANTPVPTGNVSVTAIASEFNGPQIVVRDADDVEGGNTGGGEELVSIRSVRDLYNSGTTSGPLAYIEGVVVSDYTTGSVTERNLHIQDESAGIVIRFDDAHSFALGTKLKITTTGLEISEYNGLLQLNNVPLSKASNLGTENVTPVVLTTQEIKDNLEQYESMLVTIENASFDGGAVLDQSVNITDATGSIVTYVRSQANFNGQSAPSGTHNITCIVSEFNEAQVVLRDMDDID